MILSILMMIVMSYLFMMISDIHI